MTSESGGDISRQPERRHEQRFQFDTEVEIEWGSSTLSARVRDISSSGMFIIPSQSLWLGATFAAKLLTDPPIQIECVVQRVEPGRGIAVKVMIPDRSSREHLVELLKGLEPVQ